MRNQVLYSTLLGAAVLFLVNGCQKPVQPDPTLTLSQTAISVPAEGGTFSVAYKVTNPREGAEVSPEASTNDWVTSLEVVDNNINFDVAVNEATEPRSVDVTVSYPGAADAVFTITQEAADPAPFVFNLKEVNATNYVFDIFPEDKEMSYILFGTTQAYLDEYGLTTDEALFQDDLEYMGGSVADYAAVGDMLDLTFSATPETETVIYAYGIDLNTNTRLTDIVYCRFTTPGVEKIEADFSITTTVDGPEVTAHVIPKGYDGYYCVEAYETASLDPDTDLYELCYSNFMSMVSFYQMLGMSADDALAALCGQGEGDWKFALSPSTEYTIVAYAVSNEAVPNSDPVSVEVTSGPLEPSDNQLTVTVTEVGARVATVNVSTTNDDPYGIYVVPSSELAEFTTDSEIMEYLLYWYYPTEATGDFSQSFTGLTPETEYSVCAFGQVAGLATTGLFRTDFITTEAEIGNATIEVVFDEYYDMAASLDVLNEIDPSLASEIESYISQGLEVLLPCYAVTEPADAEFYYYGLYSYDESMFEQYNDNDIINTLMMDSPADPSTLYVLNYGEPLIFLGVALDANGNPGPLFKGEPFTLTPEEAADPEGLWDLFGASASTKSSAQTGFSIAREKMSVPEGISVRKDVEAPVAKVYTEPVVVTSSSIELPDENMLQNAKVLPRTFYKK